MTAHVLERFVRCSFTFPRLLIDNKQARCFSFEFRSFDLSPRKQHGMVYFRLIKGIVFTEQSSHFCPLAVRSLSVS